MQTADESRWRTAARIVLALFYALAGTLHLVSSHPFVSIVPNWVPQPAMVVAFTGAAELLGAAGLLQPLFPLLRRAAGWGLALYALCVWPANLHHLQIDMAKPDHGLGLGYHLPRLLLQPAIMWWALWASGAVAWPWAAPKATPRR